MCREKGGCGAAELFMASQTLVEPDMSLLRRFTETGDRGAFAEIVRRYAPVVYAASHRILGDEARAQDVSQETFFRLMQRPKLVTQSLGGWLHRAATHLAIDAKRSDLSRKNREKTYWIAREKEGGHEPQWAEVSPYVDQALNELTEPLRTLLVRHFLQGTPQADLAAEANASPATISRKIKAGIEELQRLLRKRGIYVALIALTEFCTRNTAEAAPPHLIMELGKMRMVGRLKLTSSPPSSAVGRASTKMLAAALSGAAIVAMVGIATVIWSAHPLAPHPDDSTTPATTKAAQPAPLQTVQIPGVNSFSSDKVVAFEMPSTPGELITVTFADTHTIQMSQAQARQLILKQTGKTLEQLATGAK
jgi:RNA polymerase sigma factor (sigma-70 family)